MLDWIDRIRLMQKLAGEVKPKNFGEQAIIYHLEVLPLNRKSAIIPKTNNPIGKKAE